MKKWIEIILGVVLGLLLIFRGAELWLGHKLKKTAAHELSIMSDGVYNLDIGRLSVGFFDRSVKIKNVCITTDSIRILQLSNGLQDSISTKSYPLVNLSIAELYVKGVSFTRRGDMQTADTIIYDNKMHESLSRSFEKLTISRIRMRGVDGEYDVYEKSDTTRYRIRRTTLEADDFDINSDPILNPFYFSDIRLTVREFKRHYQHGSLTMIVDTLSASTKNAEITVNHFKIDPQYPKTEFAYRTPERFDWLFYDLGNIQVWGVDFARLSLNKSFEADSVSLASLDAGSYKDRNVHRKEWKKYMFFESLHKLPLKMRIGRVRLADGTAFYEERGEGASEAGTIWFGGLRCLATNVSNIQNSGDKYMTLEASGRMMDLGGLNFKLTAPVDSTDSRFRLDGTFAGMDLRAMNPVLEPLAKVRIDEGRINSMNFYITGNAYRSSVEMTMLYEGLKIMILKETDDGEEKDRRFLSTLANSFVLRDSNPDEWGKLHTGTGSFERDIYRSQFNYLWKSLAPGIMNSVGVPKSLIK